MAVVVRAQRQNSPAVVNEGAIALLRVMNTITLDREVTPPLAIP